MGMAMSPMGVTWIRSPFLRAFSLILPESSSRISWNFLRVVLLLAAYCSLSKTLTISLRASATKASTSLLNSLAMPAGMDSARGR